MTPEQQRRIEDAWAKHQSTSQRVARAGEALKNAGLAKEPPEKMDELNRRLQDAIKANADALEEVADAMRAAGINV